MAHGLEGAGPSPTEGREQARGGGEKRPGAGPRGPGPVDRRYRRLARATAGPGRVRMLAGRAGPVAERR